MYVRSYVSFFIQKNYRVESFSRLHIMKSESISISPMAYFLSPSNFFIIFRTTDHILCAPDANLVLSIT